MRAANYIIDFYRRTFGRRVFYKLNRALFFLSLRGLGIGNWETAELSGEKDFIERFAKNVRDPVILDIGANVGNYSNLLKEFSPKARIFAFEPHPFTFEKLSASASRNGYEAINAACGSEIGSAKLYDHPNQTDSGTEHASMFKGVIEEVHSDASTAWDIRVITLDGFVEENNIDHIDLLKIDVEGGEMNVMLGAKVTLASEKIDFIHFEFTEANTVSRVFMKDFYELLDGFEFYRMVVDGLVPMGPYYSPLSEIFAYQNVVAVRTGTADWV